MHYFLLDSLQHTQLLGYFADSYVGGGGAAATTMNNAENSGGANSGGTMGSGNTVGGNANNARNLTGAQRRMKREWRPGLLERVLDSVAIDATQLLEERREILVSVEDILCKRAAKKIIMDSS